MLQALTFEINGFWSADPYFGTRANILNKRPADRKATLTFGAYDRACDSIHAPETNTLETLKLRLIYRSSAIRDLRYNKFVLNFAVRYHQATNRVRQSIT